MVDIRAILVAFGGLLLAAVLGAVLATNSQWVVLALVLTVVCFGAAAVLSVPRVRQRYRWLQSDKERELTLARRLGAELDACHALQRNIAPLKDEAQVIADVRQRTEAWTGGVVGLLDSERPGWSAVFLGNPVHPQSMSQYGERDKVRNFLQQREATLRELIARLG